MFKGIVGKVVKNMLIDPIKAPHQAASTPKAPATSPAPMPVVEVEQETYGIELPYYPGNGTACGDTCRCRWQIEKRWSAPDQANAIHVTWLTTGDGSVCPDCQQRARDWQDVLVRFEEN